ncbi:hypothetical protein CIK67_17530 [Brachybacterium alimentarium]|nr:hypothetical protein [Kocuria sp.]RCS80219.1 hypothetical protein CIK67_17530 [Brachybacterium alimentarium]
MATPRFTSHETPLARRLLAFGLALASAVAGIIVLLCVSSLGVAGVQDLLSVSLPELMAPDPNTLGVQWLVVRGWLIVCTPVAIASGIGARHVLHFSRRTAESHLVQQPR